jgi:enterochelin esterase-like enzyme/fibronectin type 3 domain-containing protein/regulation of enolase protein 1 (concanavalin A-like superfamily)
VKLNASAQGTGKQLTLALFILATLLVMPPQLMAQPLPTLPPVGYDQSGRFPAGTVAWNVSYYSSVAGRNLNMHVYTPPGYNPTRKYGVVYCYQGIGVGADTTFLDWSVYAGLVADNLIGEGKIKPVIIVALDDQFDGNFSDVSGMTIRDAIPYVDSHYSTYADADNRGVYGYSWGGGYAFNVGCGNLDTFHHIAPSSAAPNKASDSSLFPNGGAEAKQKLKTLLIACGTADGLYGASEGAHNYCVANGIPHAWWPVAGGGHWANEVWRPHMWNFLQMAYAAGLSDPPLPRSAYAQNEAENFDRRQGVTPESCSEGGQNIGSIQSGAYVAYNNVDFGTGAVSFNARVASATSGGTIEIRLGSTNGTLIGTCPVSGTGGWQTWTTVSTTISGVSGIQNVYLRFTGGAGFLFNVNWWQFDGPISPVAIPPMPGGLVAASGKERAVLRWNTSSGATSYNVKRSITSDGTYSTIASVAGTNHTDTTAIGGTTYYYTVSALNIGGESDDTSFASVTPALDVPSPWLAQDIGSVGLPGWASFTNGVFTVTGCGADIAGASDAFRFVHVETNGNCSIVARVASLESHVSTWSKAGVMIRESLDTNAANAFIAVTPGNGVTWQYRSTTGGVTTSATTAGPSAPYWVRLVRSGNTFIGSYSSDGVNWTQLGTATFAMSSSAHVGLAVTSRNLYTLCTATFDRVNAPGWAPLPAGIPSALVAAAGVERVTLNWTAATNATSYNVKRATSSGGPYTTITNVVSTNFTDTRVVGRTTYYYVASAVNSLAGESANSGFASATPTLNVPLPWLTRDIGTVGLPGGAGLTNNVFTVTGSGGDIWDSSDAFRFVHVATNSSNFSITARVLSIQNTHPWAKAGVMIRSSLDANAVNAFVAVTRGNGVTFQYRSSTGGNSLNNAVTGLVAPYWIRLVRSGDTFTAFRSVNGTSWTQHGSVTLTNLSTLYIGLAVTSHTNSQTCAATFDNVTLPGWPPTALAAAATAVSSSQVTLSWNPAANATSYNVKRSLTSGGPYTTIATGIANTSFVDYDAPVSGGCFYVISAVVGGSEIPDGPEAALSFSKLSGGIIGTPGSWNNSGATIANVFDGDLNTFFDAPSGNGAWAGVDFGTDVSNVITRINYCPRTGFESRMVGGFFQGANQANFSGAVTLYTVTVQPAAGVLTSVNIVNTTPFQYVRYLSPNNGFGNVSEVEFYGYQFFLATPPLMQVELNGTDLAFSWPAANEGFTLQSCTNLMSGNWENVVSPSPQMIGNQWQVTLPLSGDVGSVFYRLLK